METNLKELRGAPGNRQSLLFEVDGFFGGREDQVAGQVSEITCILLEVLWPRFAT